MKYKISYKKVIGWLLIGISLVMLLNSIRLCFSSDIWYDELFTIGMIEHSYGELIGFTARDVHPPLYYCITKFVVDLCKLIYASADGIMIAKIVSVMPYFLLLLYGLTFLQKRFGTFATGVFFFCILSMPQMSAYTVEVRMYSWALFFVTAAFFHAYGIVCFYEEGQKDAVKNTKKDTIHYIALSLYGLAAAYTQYFACVAIIMVYVYLLVWFVVRYKIARNCCQDDSLSDKKAVIEALKKWLLCVVVSIIGYLPWLFVLVSQITTVRENYWILPLTWRNLGGCVKFLMKPAFQKEGVNVVLAVLLFLIYVGLLTAYSLMTWRRAGKNDKQQSVILIKFWYAFAGCMVLVGLVAFGFIASIMIRPIFVYRYMLPAMGCFWLCFALCLDALTGRDGLREQIRTGLLQIVISLILIMIGIRDYRAFMGEEEYKIVLMQETKQAISDIAAEDIIVYNFDQLQAVSGYYMEQESYLWNGVPEQLIVEMFGNKGTIQSTEQIKEWLAADRVVWFFGSFNSREDIIEEWREEGLKVEEQGSYLLERYWFNIYSITE